MAILLKYAVFYLAGSIIAGSIMGAGFATNLSPRPNKKQLQALQRLGTYVPLQLAGIDGGLIAKANERRPTIVYIHGRSANRTELAPLAEALFREGYNAVLWDRKSRQISYGPREIDQVGRIVATLRESPYVVTNEIYLLGFSLGAAVAIGAAAADDNGYIRGVVADSPYADLKKVASRYLTVFGVVPKPVAWPTETVALATARLVHSIDFDSLNPAAWAEQVRCPVLLIHGKSDKRIPHTHSEQIFERLTTVKDLWLVERAGHTKAFAGSPAEYVRRVLGFLQLQ
jgi:alpha-beta hydrolase superfamily lysophospholipase